jgi:hypothetical protein
MAFTPEGVRNFIADEITTEVSAAEERIDKMLVASERIGRLRTYGVKGMSETIRKSVIKLYEDHGWDIKIVPDQRDGDYMIFTPKEETKTKAQPSPFYAKPMFGSVEDKPDPWETVPPPSKPQRKRHRGRRYEEEK